MPIDYSRVESRFVSRATSWASVLGPRASEIRKRFEVPILIAALLVVPVIVIEEQATSSGLLGAAQVLNWLIWAAFVAEFVSVLVAAENRLGYVRLAWLDLAIILFSFPLLPAAFASSRLLRLVRLLRIGTVLTRGTSAIRSVFGGRGIGFAAALTLVAALGAAGIFMVVDPEDRTFGDAIWWAIVTITTVGYGDIVPQTTVGRAAGIVVMLVGVGFVAILTAAIAAHFVGQEENDELRQINERLDRIEAALRTRSDVES
jgi:voltage-gated potassium channel